VGLKQPFIMLFPIIVEINTNSQQQKVRNNQASLIHRNDEKPKNHSQDPVRSFVRKIRNFVADESLNDRKGVSKVKGVQRILKISHISIVIRTKDRNITNNVESCNADFIMWRVGFFQKESKKQEEDPKDNVENHDRMALLDDRMKSLKKRNRNE